MVEPDSDEETATGRHRGPNGRLLGLLLIGLGTVWFLNEIRPLGLSGQTVRAATLTLLGAGLIYTARRGRGGGRSLWPIILGVILTFSLLGNARSGADVGPYPHSPRSIADGGGNLGTGGQLYVDLSTIPVADLETKQITMRLGTGQVTVLVPPDIHLRVVSHVGRGQVAVCDQVSNGVGIDPHYDNGRSGPPLTLDIDVGRGSIQVMGCRQSTTSSTT